MSDLSSLSALYDQHRYFDVILAISELSDAAFAQLVVSTDLRPTLRLVSDCAAALSLPTLGAQIHRRAIHALRRSQPDLALTLSDEALLRWPEDVVLHRDCALFFSETKHAQAAEKHFRCALELEPEDASLLLNYANYLSATQRDEEAEINCLRALQLNPALPAAHNNLANLYKRVNRPAEAEYHYRSAIAVKPEFYEGHFNYGVFLQGQDRLDEAVAAYRRAISVDPEQGAAYNNLGSVLLDLGRPEDVAEVEQSYVHALRLAPDNADRRVNLAIVRLSRGRLGEAWPDYEARESPNRQDRMTFPPPCPFERWQGQPLEGKSILVWREQGLGDQILFARYLAKLKSLGVRRVVLCCSPPLKTMFAGLAGVDLLVDDKDPIPQCDYWTYLCSLPMHFNTEVATIPAAVPYLMPQAALVEALGKRLTGQSGLKIGVCWRGSAAYSNERQRSPGLARFKPLFAIQGLTFFTLLPVSRDEFLAQTGSAGFDLGHEIDANTPAFGETAALMQQLDLIITSDTSIAHLAGALGRPTWLLLSKPAYWTWMLEREDTPWYPTMRLFRQSDPGNWDEVFGRVEAALRAFAAGALALSFGKAKTLQAPIAAGELLDKISILKIKAEHIVDPVKLKNIQAELTALETVVTQAGLAPAAIALLEPLRAVNQELWVIEDDIRECERRQDFGPAFVALARSVYFTNDRRAALKRQINDLSGSALTEEKSYASY